MRSSPRTSVIDSCEFPHVEAGDQIWVLRKSSKCPSLLSQVAALKRINLIPSKTPLFLRSTVHQLGFLANWEALETLRMFLKQTCFPYSVWNTLIVLLKNRKTYRLFFLCSVLLCLEQPLIFLDVVQTSLPVFDIIIGVKFFFYTIISVFEYTPK